MPERTVFQLQRLIVLATRLGFKDDVAHWKAELKKTQDKEANHG